MTDTKNAPEVIRQLVSNMKDELEKDSEHFPDIIKEMEEYTSSIKDPATAAVFHSLTAEMYGSYYNQNLWEIQKRTRLADFVPEDIREWTSNIFEKKIEEELKASLEQTGILQETDAEIYRKILDTQSDARELRPTLYDFLMQRAIEIEPARSSLENYYESWIAFRKSQGNRKAELMVVLEHIAYQNEKEPIYSESSLDSLYDIYPDKECQLEIALAQLEMMQRNSYRPYANQDSLNSIIYDFCKQAIADFSSYKRSARFYNTVEEMERPAITVKHNNNVYPGENLSLQLSYKNISKVKVRIYRNNASPAMAMRQDQSRDKGKLVKEEIFNLPKTEARIAKDTVLQIPVDQCGLYLYQITSVTDGLSVTAPFSVSRLAAVVRQTADGKNEVLVTDFKSGEPLPDISVICYNCSRQWTPVETGKVKTDNKGFALLNLPKWKKVEAVRPISDGDTASLLTNVGNSYQRKGEKDVTNVSLFTDRSIYRPGQTVYFKGILYTDNGKQVVAASGESYTVTLRDANYKEVAQKSFTTNDFGSFHGEFTLPKSSLNGFFTLVSPKATLRFRVEEYKRPSFRITMDTLKEEVSFNERLVLRGKAESYSGVALSSGKVNWYITTRPFWLRGYMPYPYNKTNEVVASGTSTIGKDGAFQIPFTPERPYSEKKSIVQSYEVNLSLTDSKGETQESQMIFSVGDAGIVLSVDMPEQMDKNRGKATITAQTLNGKNVKTKGRYTLMSIKEAGKNSETGEIIYEKDEQKSAGGFSTDKPIGKEAFELLPSGRYRLLIQGKDERGKAVETQKDFVLYSMWDQKPPVKADIWLPKTHYELKVGQTANVIFGTTKKELYLLYEIFAQNGETLHKEIVRFGNGNRGFPINFKDIYGDGVTASFTYIKDGELHSAACTVTRKEPDRKITIIPETFRDHLLPGNTENWKFRLIDADSVAVYAEVLASMYDASLDAIAMYGWDFSPKRSYTLLKKDFHSGFALSRGYRSDIKDLSFKDVYEYRYDRLYDGWYTMLQTPQTFGVKEKLYLSKGSILRSGGNTKMVMEVDAAQDMAMPLAEEAVEAISAENSFNEEEAMETPVKHTYLRENLLETAFFYPILQTDDDGNVSFDFTIPESNTTWKLQLLAQTKDMKYGYLSEEIISSKPVMVQPNMPRFLREGDNITIYSQILNQTDSTLDGEATIELFVPEDGKIIYRSNKRFISKAYSTETVSWNIDVDDWSAYGVIGCRIKATTDKGNDGEQHLLPILPRQIMITESIPFYLMDENRQTIQLPKQATENPYRLTFELTANPIWYAVQALSTIDSAGQDDLLTWLAVYYSNTLSQYIANANPKIKSVIDSWQSSAGNSKTLLSALENDSELKTILSAETPWVMEAKDETEQKHRLQLLFDMNRAAGLKQEALGKLRERQTADGGWSWMPGMQSSRHMTVQILKGMAQLTDLKAIEYTDTENKMQYEALKFIDSSIQKDYERDKRYNSLNNIPSEEKIEMLYVRSLYRDVPETGNSHAAYMHYAELAEKYWEKYDLYSRAAICKIMLNNGNRQTASAILDWFKKTATVDKEKGMYWANNRAAFSVFHSALETHCLLMALFAETEQDTLQNDRLKQWLLGQKRTQNWESVPASVNAIYALLLTGSSWIEQTNSCQIEWDKQRWSSEQGETATGYLKVSPDKQHIRHAKNKPVTIYKQGNAPAWGAVYMQYFTPIESIEKSKGVLNVEKKLFVETVNNGKRQLMQVSEDKALNVGDKAIVRLTLRSDRAMNYVILKDLRPACMEPAEQLSGTEYRDGVYYYRSSRDLSENIYIENMPEGTFVLEYPVYVSRKGKYSGGLSTIQCLYAPEYVSHTEGTTLTVE